MTHEKNHPLIAVSGIIRYQGPEMVLLNFVRMAGHVFVTHG